MFEQHEYGVNGIQYSEKWTDVNELVHWLLPVGRVIVISTKELADFFTLSGMLSKLATLISKASIQKIIFRIKVDKEPPKKIKEAFCNYKNLENTKLVFAKGFVE